MELFKLYVDYIVECFKLFFGSELYLALFFWLLIVCVILLLHLFCRKVFVVK